VIDPELRAVIDRLKKAGTEFSSVPVSTRTKKVIPDAVPLWKMSADAWAVEWVPFFNLLPPEHPESAFVAEQATKFYADPAYAFRLADTACEIHIAHQEEEANRAYRDVDWEVP
jgi:hypothetical protein